MSQQATDQRSHSSFSRKPSLRTNTSSSTTFSSMSSMTSASSSVASPTAFSPSFKHEAFASSPPPPHFARDLKESERVFSPTLQYSPTTAAHLPRHLQQQETVVEPSVLQDNSQRVDTQEARHDYLDPGHFDTSATSNSSADTVAPVQHALRTTGAEDNSTAEQQSRTERSSSSSSSSSSLLSESKDSKEPYETPLTAHLGQNDNQKRMSNESGYPFPAVAPQSQRREGQTTKQVNHDPWKHTDDLLAPSGKSTQHNVSSQRSNSGINTSALSLTKPSPAESGVQQVSTSQTPTPTAAGMDRRDSQSSSVSSDSRKLVTSKAPMQTRGGTVVLSQALSSGNLSKLSSSSSPIASGGLTSFSPLSALVEPFSPSSNPVGLPSKGSPLPQATANVGPTHIASTGRAQPSEHVDRHSETQAHYQEVIPQRGAYRDERTLEGSTTSSSGDTGYFSNPARHAGYGQTYQQGPASATSVHNTSSIDQYQPSHFQERQDARSARQRSWSENEAIENAPGLAYLGSGNTRIVPQSSATGQAPWASSQQAIQEHVESSFSATVPAASYGYADPRYPRPLGPYATGGLADNEHYMRGGLPSGVGDVRHLPVGQSIDAFDAARYGFVPGSVSDVSTAGAEEISTIFVVGFPEDIQEREFQNMFLFARGFEAATLKIPASTAAARERDAAAAAAVSAIAATLPAFSIPPPPPALDPNHGYGSGLSSAGGSSYDHLNNSLYEEAFLATSSGTVGPHGHVENAQRVSSALAAAALTATASTASLANTTNKKQIIGFAKFRSREDALVARDVLSGRKIDPEKGCVLKAEMAKKNLHVKKNGSDIQGSSLPVLRPDLVATPQEGTSALDRLAEREREREWRARMAAASGVGSRYESSTASASYPQSSEYREADNEHEMLNEPTSRNSAWSDATYEAFHSVSQDQGATSDLAQQDRRFSTSSSISRSSPQHFMQGSNNTPSAAQASAAALAARQRTIAGTSNFGKTLLQQLDDQEDVTFPLPDPSPGFGASAYSSGEQGTRRQPPPAALPTATSVGTLGNHVYLDEDYRKLALQTRPGHDTSLANQAARDDASGYQPQLQQPYNTFHGANATTPTSTTTALGTGARRFTSPDLVSPTFTDFRQPRTQNRADDNMPISTLYVGGLPSSLPSLAGSVNASQLEDALRNVFARCPGFRRMSFRHKSQGPMCFIEFEDTQHATRALNEIYGHTLGGLVKGGIRLAYSKNPLGVRGSGSNGPDSPTPLSPSYFASDIYTQPGYYGSPSGGHPGAAQVPTPTIHSRSAQYDQHGYPTAPGDYSSPPASQQAFGFSQHPQQFQNRPGAHQSGFDQRHGLDRRATSPSAGPGSAFSPFALER